MSLDNSAKARSRSASSWRELIAKLTEFSSLNASSNFGGLLVNDIFTRVAAVSSKSIDLSGSCLPAMYLLESFTEASTASSEI